jgi:transcription-repair coupling factor (superfamily II helicase)
MRRLREAYLDDPRVVAAASALADDRSLTIGACHGGLVGVLVAAVLARRAGTPPLIVCNDPAGLAEELDELGIVSAHLPQLDRFAEDDGASDRAGLNRRMAALEAYSAGAALVADPVAVEQPVPDLVQVAKSSLVVRPGDSRDLHALVERLVEAGYRVTPVVEGRGEVAVRGGIVDVYPWIGQDPLRLEFFGDQVEAVRRFDAFTQESIARADEAVLATASGGLATRDLWSQLPPSPIVVIGDLPLRGRLAKDHRRNELRFARQLEEGAIDGASLGVERLRGDLRRGLMELRRMASETGSAESGHGKTNVLLLARNQESAAELSAHCADAALAVEIRVGRLSAGFRDLETGLVVVHDFELMEREPVRRRTARIAGGEPLSSLTDLRRNDFVVHLNHGIGVFRGIATLERRGFLEDYLLLEFAEGTKLYVPVDAIDLVQKYVGATGKRPELSRIGGAAWAKKRARAEKAIQDMSAELLRGQALRLAAGGIVFPEDTAELRQFEARFPFEETEDQLAAGREIKGDMERPVAMDRLLCGDVGFGKTEVAMRAACKAVLGGHQVAVLVPTTLLAEQHLETFGERFEGMDVRIAGMNRFHTADEKRAALAGAAQGKIDILIGTHAILTDRLAFRSLGLLVIDEEHRFGVKQKEKLRALRGTGLISGARRAKPAEADATDSSDSTEEDAPGLTVIQETPEVDLPPPNAKPPDVLTLSATPIPRTLHFSLLGLRDISVLAEAPADRLAVETRVSPWDDQLIRHALTRELERQGQVFVVTNRIQDLDHLAWRLSRLSPATHLDTIHGRMDEERIARVMESFRHHRLDCLVTTSIIESGIDIPNANTLIVNNAHCFGLAELHQIRGRIGRFSRQAHAYFITPPNRELGAEARERLNAIQEYAELGAGFKLAMRDLELRGAGNLLGAAQSGHIDAIGYELYTRLLAEVVARAKAAAEAAAETTAKPGKSAPSKKTSNVGEHAGASGASRPSGREPPEAKAGAESVGRRTSSAASKIATESTLGLQVDAYIPDTWLETPALKFELHKQLDSCRRLGDLGAIARAARDRYGPLAEPVARLFQVRAIRLRCQEMGISRIDVQDRQIRLRINDAMPRELSAVKLPELVHLQLDSDLLVLFLKKAMAQDAALAFICRLLGLDLGFLGFRKEKKPAKSEGG